MYCFRLHFSDFIVLYFQKIKNLLQFTFEKNNLLCKKREKNNLSRGKIPAPPPPPGYQMVHPLQKEKRLTNARSDNMGRTIS